MADHNSTPSKEFFNEIFSYEDGKIYWKKKNTRNIIVGSMAGNLDSKGYLRVCINYKEYRVHRVIFLMHYGFLPEFIDHIDGNKVNNRIQNLRPVTKSQNLMNTKINKRNTSGVRCVSWSKNKKQWLVQVNKNGKSFYRGCFDDLISAKIVADIQRKNCHQEFFKHS